MDEPQMLKCKVGEVKMAFTAGEAARGQQAEFVAHVDLELMAKWRWCIMEDGHSIKEWLTTAMQGCVDAHDCPEFESA